MTGEFVGGSFLGVTLRLAIQLQVGGYPLDDRAVDDLLPLRITQRERVEAEIVDDPGNAMALLRQQLQGILVEERLVEE